MKGRIKKNIDLIKTNNKEVWGKSAAAWTGLVEAPPVWHPERLFHLGVLLFPLRRIATQRCLVWVIAECCSEPWDPDLLIVRFHFSPCAKSFLQKSRLREGTQHRHFLILSAEEQPKSCPLSYRKAVRASCISSPPEHHKSYSFSRLAAQYPQSHWRVYKLGFNSFELTSSLNCPRVIDGIAGSTPDKCLWCNK